MSASVGTICCNIKGLHQVLCLIGSHTYLELRAMSVRLNLVAPNGLDLRLCAVRDLLLEASKLGLMTAPG